MTGTEYTIQTRGKEGRLINEEHFDRLDRDNIINMLQRLDDDDLSVRERELLDSMIEVFTDG